ncbi:MAG TPA: metallophosphoesterase [Thermoleophilaceae bacterium]|nr:metallophosphoesterase [Thermoleophilaceae bacterium]
MGAAIAAAAAALAGTAQEPPATDQRAVVWAVGDGGDGSLAARRMAARIARDRPDRFLYLGDVYDTGTAAEFRRNYEPSYGRLKRITEPTSGNHDWPNRHTGYLPYWRRAKGRPQRYWYSFRLGGWQVLSLNSEAAHGAGSPQLRWLRERLREPGTCRLAFAHRPRFAAAGLHGDSPDMSAVWNTLRGHTRIVLGAHEHSLQRMRRRDGMTQYVAGAGGSILYSMGRDRRLAFGRAKVTGALRIVLEPGRATLEFRTSSGALLDRSRAACRPPGEAL